VIATLLATLSAPQRAMAVDILDDPIQIDERVTQLIQTSNSLCWEMYRYHQKQTDFTDNYRAAKQLWTQATQIQEAIRTGPVETQLLQQRMTELNQGFTQLEKSLSKWDTGDRTSIPMTSGPTLREVVAPGTSVDLPLLGIHVGGPDVVVTEDGTPQLQRLRLHPNSHGSKRSLEREVAAVKVALSYLSEDVGVSSDDQIQEPAVSDAKPSPAPPKPGIEEVVQPRKAPAATPPAANPK
jgi:hypothetical protein